MLLHKREVIRLKTSSLKANFEWHKADNHKHHMGVCAGLSLNFLISDGRRPQSLKWLPEDQVFSAKQKTKCGGSFTEDSFSDPKPYCFGT